MPYFRATATSLSISGGPSSGEDGSVTGSPTSSKNFSGPAGVMITAVLPCLVATFLKLCSTPSDTALLSMEHFSSYALIAQKWLNTATTRCKQLQVIALVLVCGCGVWVIHERRGRWILRTSPLRRSREFFKKSSCLAQIGDVSSLTSVLVCPVCHRGDPCPKAEVEAEMPAPRDRGTRGGGRSQRCDRLPLRTSAVGPRPLDPARGGKA